jgi:hypothetical protein
LTENGEARLEGLRLVVRRHDRDNRFRFNEDISPD